MIRPGAPYRAARLAALVLASFVAVLGLAGCGPGEGGTGLPPPASGSATVGAPDATLPPPTPATLLAAGVPADVAGTIAALDDRVLVIGDVALPRDAVDAVLADGRPAPPGSLAVGARATAWRLGERWLVQLGP
jgi:hypothetical protein